MKKAAKKTHYNHSFYSQSRIEAHPPHTIQEQFIHRWKKKSDYQYWLAIRNTSHRPTIVSPKTDHQSSVLSSHPIVFIYFIKVDRISMATSRNSYIDISYST
eukprot:scaffold3017_cov270-Alexandrium_tamarense.AAC.4